MEKGIRIEYPYDFGLILGNLDFVTILLKFDLLASTILPVRLELSGYILYSFLYSSPLVPDAFTCVRKPQIVYLQYKMGHYFLET